MPKALAAELAAIATALSAGVCTTMTGRPRRPGFSCCSDDAKKASRSRNSHCTAFSVVDAFIVCSLRHCRIQKAQLRGLAKAMLKGLLPQLVRDEFARNKERIIKESGRSLAGALKRTRVALWTYGDPRRRR